VTVTIVRVLEAVALVLYAAAAVCAFGGYFDADVLDVLGLVALGLAAEALARLV
jgi:hypothetical protein